MNTWHLLPVAFIALTACTTTTVVLVSDPDGKVGQVAVMSDGKTTLLDHERQAATVTEYSSKVKSAVLDEAQIAERFASVLENEPRSPARYVFHFATGSSELMAEEMPTLDLIAAEIKTRKSCDGSVIGHSDSTGDAKANQETSSERANAVAAALAGKGVDAGCLDIRFYGDKDPVVRTPAGVSEPLNRRVEVEIR